MAAGLSPRGDLEALLLNVAPAGPMDIAIRGGTVVAATGTFLADIGIAGERIAQVGGGVPRAAREIDARGKLLLPGCVDIHTHLGAGYVDDFDTGTRAATAGGVTTVAAFAHQRDGEGLRPALERAMAEAAKARIDFTFHVVLGDPTPKALAEIAAPIGVKVFMVAKRFEERADDYLAALRAAGRAGMVTAVHAEDAALVAARTRELLESGRTGVEWFPESRPPLAEEVAVRRAIEFADTARAPIYLVHLSSRGALGALREAKARELPVYGETRPIYLYLTRERFREPDGAKYVGQPPLRDRDDVGALWSALADGTLDAVCTDHYPHRLADKLDPKHTFATIPPGVPNLETLLPMLYSEGVRTGRLTLERLVTLVATDPARIAGLAPRKGAIVEGADADLVVFDPGRTRVIRADDMRSACDYDPFEGWVVTGWPEIVLARGEVVFAGDRVLGEPGRGRFVPRRAA